MKRFLKCACKAKADMNDPRSCSGWIILPKTICPACVARDLAKQEVKGRRTPGVKKSLQKRRGRGQELCIHGKIESKRDPNLQKRIDLVVRMAQERERDHNTDVMHSFHHVARSSLKASRVG